MAFQVFWHIPHQVLCLELEGHLSLQDFSQINEAILNVLNSEAQHSRITLLVNAINLSSVPQAFQQLRASQAYVERPDLKHIVVATTNKMIRLMMLLTFNLSRPSLRMVDDLDQAQMVLRIV